MNKPEKDEKVSFKEHWFWSSVYNNKATYTQIALASLFINIFGLGSAFYIMTVYDRVMPNNAYNTLVALTIGMGIVIIFDFIVKLLRAYFIDIAGQKLDQNVNNSIFKKILSHDNDFLSKSHGVQAVVREFEGVRDFFTTASMVAFIDIPFMFIFLFVIYSIAGPVAIVPIALVPIILGVSALIQPLLKRYANSNLKLQQDKSTTLSELLQNVETVRTVAGGDFLKDKWKSSVEQQSKSSATGRAVTNFGVTFSQTGLQISQAAIVCYGVVLVGRLEITSGALIACVILSGRILSPLVQAGQLLTRLNSATAAYSKVNELMTSETRDEETKDYKASKITNGDILVKDLEYSIEETTILKDINFSLSQGEKVGIVGNIGSGKTTLLRNLIGFVLPTSGTINVGGYDIRNIPTDELRSSIGYCPQKVQLFNGTIYENITAGYEDVTEEAVIESATLAGAHEFIGKLSGGYSYPLVNGGANLSGGQRQSIALARALIRKPKILVLDEPTSSMDGNLETLIINNLSELDFKPTIIISTHRTSHLNVMDKIGIIIDGKMVAFGPKDQIIQQQNQQNQN